MLKQLPSRNQRTKGFKTKHFIQACLLIAICIWLLNQLKHSYENNAHKNGAGVINKAMNEPGSIKLGRKGIQNKADGTTSEIGRHQEVGTIEDEVESMSEDNEDEGGGGGDDEIDGRYQKKAGEEETEGVDDLIDLEDKDKEEESEDQIEGKGNIHEAREEHYIYKGDDASNSVELPHHSQTTSSHVQIRRLRQVKEEDSENGENIESLEIKNDSTKMDTAENRPVHEAPHRGILEQ